MDKSGRFHSLLVERSSRVIVAIDLVESVRLMQADEAGAVKRWVELIDHINTGLLPKSGGRLVKSHGDGALLEFAEPRSALACTFQIMRDCAIRNEGLRREQTMLLRAGMALADIFDDERDIYGHGVNLAARLATLAQPGDIIASSALRDNLLDELDAQIEDMGDRFLKHIDNPVRCYRLHPPGTAPKRKVPGFDLQLLPTIAVLPFDPRLNVGEFGAVGNVIAEELTRLFSSSSMYNVISSMSSRQFANRKCDVSKISARLGASFVVTGTFTIEGKNVIVSAELVEAKTGHVLWSERLHDRLDGILNHGQELVVNIGTQVSQAIVSQQVRLARTRPLPTLENYVLLMAGVNLMHRQSVQNFKLAYEIFDEVLARSSRQAMANAWKAKWYILRGLQGWAENSEDDARKARDLTRRALDEDPDSSLALAIDGMVHTQLLGDLDGAAKQYQSAVDTNPNDAMAWALKGGLHAFVGEGQKALHDTERGISLSPFDPLNYFFDTLAATASNTMENYEDAIVLCKRSLRSNAYHSSTRRTLITALWHAGYRDEAKLEAAKFMELNPGYSVSQWRGFSSAAPYELGKRCEEAFLGAGIPKD